ncbi:MAG: Rrf2 family transcriptional regulator [Candidatus Limivicinus sp.]
MMISTRGRYALRILVDMAENRKDGYITLKEAADRQEISEKYLESIVKDLVRGQLLEGIRGKGGGYRLARPAEEITVLEVLQAAEGSMVPVACLEEGSKPCSRADACRTLPLWEGLNRVINEYLAGFTVQDLVRDRAAGFDGDI